MSNRRRVPPLGAQAGRLEVFIKELLELVMDGSSSVAVPSLRAQSRRTSSTRPTRFSVRVRRVPKWQTC